ncbi:ketopantoate reductase family protein [Halomonas sp. QX-2]|jgi:2-dehydropantoate 2-reductase|uniref:2-dehydropantoate 2-reductase n=1 Tax=Vreelandella sedimenti TaxID=2729618 RepID=A0A7Z0SNX2_9GAMM|nr:MULTISPECIES: ketopantoate reductase family protein [Halomonas]NYT71994.1 ketopantoate reductase family protein [Halomonas sedimenti]
MKIAIVGAGAMGCLFAARLALSGSQVHLIDVDPATIATIRTKGITLTLDDGECQHLFVPIHFAEQLQECFNLLIVLTKGAVTSAAIRSVLHLITPDTRVLTLQNGLGNAALIAGHITPVNILHGITTIAADLQGPGEAHGNRQGHIYWWRYSGVEDLFMQQLNELLQRAGFNSCLDPEIDSRIWEKVAFNAALNALCTLLNGPVGVVGQHPQGKQLIQKVVQECRMVAVQAGVAFDQPRVFASITQAVTHQAHHLPSMLQDRRACRATEVEAIHGAILRIAGQHQVHTPTLETLYCLLKLGEPPCSAPSA